MAVCSRGAGLCLDRGGHDTGPCDVGCQCPYSGFDDVGVVV